MTVIIGNWKCYGSSKQGQDWFNRFRVGYRPADNLQVVVAPPVISLESLALQLEQLKLVNVSLAAQDISPFPRGDYTGAIAADMVRPFVSFVLIGQSERRKYFHETDQDIMNKVEEAVESGLMPVICIAGEEGIAALSSLSDLRSEHLIVALGAERSMNFKIADDPARVGEIAARIKAKFPAFSVVYEGPVPVKNAEKYLAQHALAGLMLGEESRDPETFASFCQVAASVLGN